MRELSEEGVVAAGGWHPRYARVLLIQRLGNEAVILMDGNGDGAEVEVEHWFCDEHGDWVVGSSSGVGALDGRPIWTWGWREGTGYVIGCVAPRRTVTVEWYGERATGAANDLGLYVALFPGQPEPRHADWETLRFGGAASGFRRLTPEETAELEAQRPHLLVSDDH